MPNSPATKVAQRRFWNALTETDGILWIQNVSAPDKVNLYAGIQTEDPGTGELTTTWHHVYTGMELATGPLPFPPEFKMARYWKLTYDNYHMGLVSVDYDGTGAWIFKPYSTKLGLVGANSWMEGDDWDTANIFYDSSPFKVDADGNNATTLHYFAGVAWSVLPPRSSLAFPWVYGSFKIATGFGQGGYLYGYLNDHYFGNNEMGGGKENEGVGPAEGSISGDLSKEYVGLWGCFGLSHGVFLWAVGSVSASWTFDLCDRAEAMAILNFNNEVAHGNPDAQQSEGWGTDIVAVHDNVVEFENGTTETYRHFTVDVSPSRGTINVYTMSGIQLHEGIDYVKDPCDRSGRSYRLLRKPKDPCSTDHRLIVTYLVTAPTLSTPKNPGRVTDPNTSANRRDINDIRGL
jgi:hypothetical protein